MAICYDKLFHLMIDKKITNFVKDKQEEFGPTIDNIDKGITESVKNIQVSEIIEDTKKDLNEVFFVLYLFHFLILFLLFQIVLQLSFYLTYQCK